MVEQPLPDVPIPQTLTEQRSVPLKPGLGVYGNRKGLCSSMPLAGRDAIGGHLDRPYQLVQRLISADG
jgi:hypothetical protein